MLLQQLAHFNDFTDEFRAELEKRVKSFGKVVRYRFDIVKDNPDPAKYNGAKIYPGSYTLDPTMFTIQDKYEKRPGKQKGKTVALIEKVGVDNKPEKFKKVRVLDREKAEKYFYLGDENTPGDIDDIETVMYLEMHPKTKNGMFPDPTKHQVFWRIDEALNAKEERGLRSARKKAMDAAESMTEIDLRNFADAMMWDSQEDEVVLRNRVEELAETDPNYFNELVGDKKTTYLAIIRKGIDNKILQYNPVDGMLAWASTGQPIVALGADAGSMGWGRYAEWFMTAGDKADKVYEKITGMLKSVPVK